MVKDFGLGKDDFWKASQGYVIITRNGIEKVQGHLGINVHYEVEEALCDTASGLYVIKAYGSDNAGRSVESYGEASPKNCRNSYPVAMAEKRALSRVVLKLSDLYQMGVYGEDEGEFTKAQE